MQQGLQFRLHQAITEKVCPAAILGIVRTNGDRLILPAGNFTYEPDSPPVQEDTIFDVASITKSIPTASLALMLIDQYKLDLEDKVITYIPELRNSYRDSVLIKHLLTQTLQFGFSLSANKHKTPDEILELIFSGELLEAPGSTFCYTNTASILLGLVIERLTGQSLDQLADEHFFGPLSMSRTTFEPLKHFSKNEIVPTEVQDWRGGLVHGQVHDESTHILQQKMTPGAAGLFSTVPDMLNFAEMLLHEGTLGGRRYFSPEIVRQMHTNQLADIGESMGLGWELNRPVYMGRHCSENTFGKTGFTGCVFVCDIERQVGFVLLANYTYPTRKPNATLIRQLRRDVADIIFEHL